MTILPKGRRESNKNYQIVDIGQEKHSPLKFQRAWRLNSRGLIMNLLQTGFFRVPSPPFLNTGAYSCAIINAPQQIGCYFPFLKRPILWHATRRTASLIVGEVAPPEFLQGGMVTPWWENWLSFHLDHHLEVLRISLNLTGLLFWSPPGRITGLLIKM